ncbi:MAG TPA: tRNA (guanosine(46)-N7)-methyltransferase TrmB [Myxococcaceae bacterium]|nr:tRNA (guanosine(46)-N7)-methyltransferase TrmB [Myxococcaceae bacterium]
MSRGPRLLPDPVGVELASLDSPPDWSVVFGFDGPLELEIGSGRGGHALEYARRNPHVRYVAIESWRKGARDTHARAQKLGLKNLRVIEGDARRLVPRLFERESLACIRLQFPDPWWKRSHQKRGLVQGEFVKLLFELLQPGGRFDLRTDVRERGERMLKELEAVGLVNPLGPGVFHPYDPDEVPSTRERRYLLLHAPVYRARLIKPATPTPET